MVLLLLSTALPPILRRLQGPLAGSTPRLHEAPAATTPTRSTSTTRPDRADRSLASLPLAAEVLASADRIDALNGDAGNHTSEIRRECERLRALARSSFRYDDSRR